MKKRKIVGKCSHCGDSIYDFQEKIELHEGCAQLRVVNKKTSERSRPKNYSLEHRWPYIRGR